MTIHKLFPRATLVFALSATIGTIMQTHQIVTNLLCAIIENKYKVVDKLLLSIFLRILVDYAHLRTDIYIYTFIKEKSTVD